MSRYAFLIGFPITINKPEILRLIMNWIWVESLETINKTMSSVFPSPMTMVKSHEKKCWNYFFEITTTTKVWWNIVEMCILKKWILSVQQKKLRILNTVRNISGVHQRKYYGSVKKNKFSFSFHLQIDKKINIKDDPMRKNDSNFNFPNLPSA